MALWNFDAEFKFAKIKKFPCLVGEGGGGTNFQLLILIQIC